MTDWFSAGFNFIMGIFMALLILIIIISIVLGLIADPPSFNLYPIWDMIKTYWLAILLCCMFFLVAWNMFTAPLGLEESN